MTGFKDELTVKCVLKRFNVVVSNVLFCHVHINDVIECKALESNLI